jgi:hypothetical protein
VGIILNGPSPTTWYWGQGFEPPPAASDTMATYLASLTLFGSYATCQRLAAIAQAHRPKGVTLTTPALVKRTLRGMNRQHPTLKRQATALTTPEIKRGSSFTAIITFPKLKIFLSDLGNGEKVRQSLISFSALEEVGDRSGCAIAREMIDESVGTKMSQFGLE